MLYHFIICIIKWILSPLTSYNITFVIMNPITYNSAVLMKEEETRAQNTCIISRKSINSSPIPRFKKPTFCKAIALSYKLNIFSPLSSRRFACPSPRSSLPSSQIRSYSWATQVTIIANTRSNNPIYAWRKSKRSTNFVFISYGSGVWEAKNN